MGIGQKFPDVSCQLYHNCAVRKLKEMTSTLVAASTPEPNSYLEEAKSLLSELEPAKKAEVLADLAITEELRRLRDSVDGLRWSVTSSI